MKISCEANANIVSDTLQDDTIVIDIISGAYYSLTKSASAFWNGFVGKGSIDVEDDSHEFLLLKALVSEGLISTLPEVTSIGDAATDIAFTKYLDMEDLLLADPIHEVDSSGWPKLRPLDE